MREDLDHFFMKIAFMYATRSTCLRRQVGAVIVKNKAQISAGYNGALSGETHCIDNPSQCIRTKLGVKSGEMMSACYANHAEENAIAHAAKNGISLEGTTLYVTCKPCINCTKMIIASGIKHLVYCGNYGTEADNEIVSKIIKKLDITALNLSDFEDFVSKNMR